MSATGWFEEEGGCQIQFFVLYTLPQIDIRYYSYEFSKKLEAKIWFGLESHLKNCINS